MRTSMRSRVAVGLVGLTAVAALIIPGPANGAGPGGGGGGGKPPTGEETSKNLSVPAVFVGGTNPYGLLCDGTAKSPDGQVPASGFWVSPLDYYFVQGSNTWQAGCLDAQPTASVVAGWGDNLTGTAKKSVGSPIRVELGLTTDGAALGLTGWEVIKLQDTLDRSSAYGTLAEDPDGDGTYTSRPVTPYPETRVWAAGATLKIFNADSGAVVYDGPAAAEVNSTGRVVYGYNLRVTAAGKYTIAYTLPGVSITAATPGTVDGETASLTITVTAGKGGGGRPAK